MNAIKEEMQENKSKEVQLKPVEQMEVMKSNVKEMEKQLDNHVKNDQKIQDEKDNKLVKTLEQVDKKINEEMNGMNEAKKS